MEEGKGNKNSQNIDQDISMEEQLQNNNNPRLNDFERIKDLGGGSWAFRAIFKSTELEPEEWANLRIISLQKMLTVEMLK